jgi:hypothetical protein
MPLQTTYYLLMNQDQDAPYGKELRQDPQTGEWITRPLTEQEYLAAEQQFSEDFTPDFRRKGLFPNSTNHGLEQREPKSAP